MFDHISMFKFRVRLKMLLPVVALLLMCLCRSTSSSEVKYPVILVPGDGGSQLVAKLNKTSAPHYICKKYTSDYENIWLNLEELIPEVIDCFVDNMRLVYDRKSHKTFNSPGVDIRTTGFGDTASVEFLDPDPVTHVSSAIAYFNPVVESLLSVGYERGKSVRGAPFDFRKAPNEFKDYYNSLKKLVEDTYSKNNNSKVVFVGHSMGNPTLLYFLNQQSQNWKDKYIQAFVSLAGVWGGAVKPLRLFASGDSLGVVIVSPVKVRPEQRSMPSTAFLMPSDQFWKPSEVLVVTEDRNYTVADYKEFFTAINFTDGYLMRQDTENLIKDLTPPGVTVHCVHGSGVKTPATLLYGKGEFPDTYPNQISGDGDGTVNMRSLLGCLRWKGKQKYPVLHTVFSGANSEHMAILANKNATQYVVDVATGKR